MTKLTREVENYFKEDFEKWAGEKPVKLEPLPAHGSDRRYFRILGKTRSAIGAYNPDLKENAAFLSFSDTFFELGLPVPEIYSRRNDIGAYIEQDLGDETLFSYLSREREKSGFSDNIVDMYKKSLDLLPRFQIESNKGLDFGKCYPRSKFDRQSMMWDLNYFKYYFLKLSDIRFDEHELELDFHAFTDFLLKTNTEYFLYRDFQSRNIMIVDNEPYFIDYQGGRKGALQYDPASLLYDAKADIPQEKRVELLEYYMESLSKHIDIDRKSFLQFYHGYVYIRIMQALGAYGYRGYYQKKKHFLLSIPFAIRNLKWLNENADLPVKLPMLQEVWDVLVDTHLKRENDTKQKLTVSIYSFSYKRGIPKDHSGNGGGFVFDCRGLRNPGRYPEYMDLTGEDSEVIDFLEKETAVQQFLSNVYSLVENSVDNYLERKFTHLMVAFGCTGGQHRSVYCAGKLQKHLSEKYNINVNLVHREQEDGMY